MRGCFKTFKFKITGQKQGKFAGILMDLLIDPDSDESLLIIPRLKEEILIANNLIMKFLKKLRCISNRSEAEESRLPLTCDVSSDTPLRTLFDPTVAAPKHVPQESNEPRKFNKTVRLNTLSINQGRV